MGFLTKLPSVLVRRLRTQGFRTTMVWLYGRGIPALTGVPMVKYSRVTPQIYVGPQYRHRGKRRLKRLRIHHSVNMRIEFDDAEQDLALDHYCHLPTVDDAAPTLEHLRRGIAFVERAVEGGGKVYIHCGGGIGRAPTMAAAYFISKGYSLDDAIGLIRKARPFIHVMPPQIEQLERFAAIVEEEGRRSEGGIQCR